MTKTNIKPRLKIDYSMPIDMKIKKWIDSEPSKLFVLSIFLVYIFINLFLNWLLSN